MLNEKLRWKSFWTLLNDESMFNTECALGRTSVWWLVVLFDTIFCEKFAPPFVLCWMAGLAATWFWSSAS